MTAFWIAAFVLAALAAAFVIVPLLRSETGRESAVDDRTRANVFIFEQRLAELVGQRDAGEITEAEFDALKTEAEKSLVSDAGSMATSEVVDAGRGIGKLPVIMALLVPLFAFIAYSDFGLSWGSIDDLALTEQLRSGNPRDTANVQQNIQLLADRLQGQPENDEGWFLLAQSYMNMEQFENAAGAFEHLVQRYPFDVDLNAFYSQALFLADSREVTPRVDAAISQTLSLDPNNLTMLEIRGLEALSREEFNESLAFFKQAQANATGSRAELIAQAIETVETMMVSKGVTPPDEVGGPPERAIAVNVTIADSVDVADDTAVFIFARAVDGPAMPLAVLRLKRKDLPREVTLTERMAMTPAMSLANFDRVEVIARISLSGVATASEDDREASSGPIDISGEIAPLTLRIE